MIFGIAALPYWLIVALLLGAFDGWKFDDPETQPRWLAGWLRAIVLLAVLGAIAVALSVAPIHWVLLFEPPLIMFTAYVIGRLSSGGLHGALTPRPAAAPAARVVSAPEPPASETSPRQVETVEEGAAAAEALSVAETPAEAVAASTPAAEASDDAGAAEAAAAAPSTHSEPMSIAAGESTQAPAAAAEPGPSAPVAGEETHEGARPGG
ncbi:MAG: hypothetical protein ACLPN5_21635 [Roseiarcus sp.]